MRFFRLRSPWRLALAFALLVAAVSSVGLASHAYLSDVLKAREHERLLGVATLKSQQIANWVDDRIVNVRVITSAPFLVDRIAKAASARSPHRDRALPDRLDAIRSSYRFVAIEIFDLDGRKLLTSGHAHHDDFREHAMLEGLADRSGPVFLDFHYEPSQPDTPLVAIAAAVRDDRDRAGTVKAIAIFVIDPAQQLFPLVRAWPTPSPTAESVLVMKDGDAVLVVSPVRHSSAPPMSLRFPKGDDTRLGVKAISGADGLVEGIDYRGVPGFAAIHAVKNTSWHIISKIDRAEVLGDLHLMTLVVVVIALLVMALAAAILLLVDRHLRLRETIELAKKEQNFRAVFDNAAAALIVHDAQTGEPLLVNRQALELNGVGSLEELRAAVRWLDPPYAFDNALALIRKAAEEGPQHLEWKTCDREGTVVWRDVRLQAITFDGQPRVLAIATDITERRRASNLLQTIIDVVDEGILLVGPEGRVLRANRPFMTLWNIPLDLLAAGDDERLLAHVVDQLAEPDGFIAEVRRLYPIDEETRALIEFKDGRVFERYSCAVATEAGRARLWSFRDITERRRIECELTRLSQAVNQASEAFVVCDSELRVQYANASFQRLFGYSLDEIGGRPVSVLVPDDPALATVNPTVMEAFSGERLRRTKDGRLIPVLLKVAPIRNPAGEVAGFVGTMTDLTAVKEVEARLNEERVHLRSVLRTIPDLVWLKDENGVYLNCNPAFERYLGATEAEIVGKTDADFLGPERAASLRESDMAAIAAGHPTVHEEWLTLAGDGSRMLVETIKTPMRDATGRVFGVLGVARNVTERRRMEQELQEALRDLDNLVTKIPAGAYKLRMLADGGLRFDYVSERWCELLDVTADEVYADPHLPFRCIHPADLDAFQRANSAAREQLLPFHWEGRLRDGMRVRWLQIDSTPTRLDNGDILWDGIQYDITDRKNGEARWRLAASVFASTYEGIVVTDADNRIVEVNPGFTRITGYTRDEVLGRNPCLLASGRQSPESYAEMWQSLGERDFWRGELWNRRKDGEVYAELISISAVRDPDGELQHYIGVFSDISRIKEHEDELVRHAYYDPLTEVPNRRLFADRLGQAVARVQRSEKLLAVCYLDLDGFKPVNDNYGHRAGDQLLTTVTARLQSVLRVNDTVGRLGGDEFGLLLTDLSRPEECIRLLERVQAVLGEPVPVDGASVVVSASIGVALCPPGDADAETLLRQADAAMYRAKAAGKNRHHIFDKCEHHLAPLSSQDAAVDDARLKH